MGEINISDGALCWMEELAASLSVLIGKAETAATDLLCFAWLASEEDWLFNDDLKSDAVASVLMRRLDRI